MERLGRGRGEAGAQWGYNSGGLYTAAVIGEHGGGSTARDFPRPRSQPPLAAIHAWRELWGGEAARKLGLERAVLPARSHLSL